MQPNRVPRRSLLPLASITATAAASTLAATLLFTSLADGPGIDRKAGATPSTIETGLSPTLTPAILAGATHYTEAYIRAPLAPAPPQCPTQAMVLLRAGTPDVTDICSDDGTILVRGKDAADWTLSDVHTRRYGPVLRAQNVPGIKVLRVRAEDMRADAKLGLGLVNVSNGIGDAVFRHLVWLGDEQHPAINDDDAWAAIALKGKDSNDTGTFTIENFEFRNLIMASGEHYRNVDGISTEKGYSGTISNGLIVNASDACIDAKGKVRIDNVYLAQCREGLKLWDNQHHGLIELGTNRFVGIIGKGYGKGTRTITIDTLIASGDPSVPLFRAEGGVVNLRIGRLVAKKEQVLNHPYSHAGSTVTVDQRIYD